MLKGSLDEPIVDHSDSIPRDSAEQVAKDDSYRFVHDHQSRFEIDLHTEVAKCGRIECGSRSLNPLLKCGEHVEELLRGVVPSAVHDSAGGPSLAGSPFESPFLSPRRRLSRSTIAGRACLRDHGCAAKRAKRSRVATAPHC